MARRRTVAAGDLTKPVTWRAFDPVATAATTDDAGRPIPQFTPMGEHWAEIEPLRGAALVNATAIRPVRWSLVTMYGGIGPIKPLDQLVYNGRTLTVEAVLDDFEATALLSIQVTEEPLNPTPIPS